MNFLRNIKHKIDNFIHWVVKSCQYAWFLRNDYDWDYAFILKLLKFKLERTRKQITKNDFIVKKSINAINKQIRKVERLIDRVLADEYAFVDPEYKRLTKKWGDLEWFEDKVPNLSNLRHSKVKTPAQERQCRRDFAKVFDRARKAHEADMDELFLTLRKHIQFWWD